MKRRHLDNKTFFVKEKKLKLEEVRPLIPMDRYIGRLSSTQFTRSQETSKVISKSAYA